MTPQDLRAAYLLAATELEKTTKQLSDANDSVRRLTKRSSELQSLVKAFGSNVCPTCKGDGVVWVQYAQDDIKQVQCEACKGVGIPR